MKAKNKWAFMFVAIFLAFNIYAQEGVGQRGPTGKTGMGGHSGVTGTTGANGKQDKKLNPGVRPDTAKMKGKDIPPDFDKSHPNK